MDTNVLGYWWTVPSVIALVVILRWIFRRSSDIDSRALEPDLDWQNPADGAMQAVYEYVIAFADSAINWYQHRRQPKRVWGVILRLGALLLTAGAGFVPLADDIFGVAEVKAEWSTVMIAAAGVFVSIDRFGGFTSGWVRYMLAQQKIERIREVFLMEWNQAKADGRDAKAMLEHAKTFLLAVGKVIDDETQEWATEFQNALKEMEKARKVEAELARTGALEVTVSNPTAVRGWMLEIDGNLRGRATAGTLAVTGLATGIRKLKATGEDASGQKLSAEATVKIDGGAVVTKTLHLS